MMHDFIKYHSLGNDFIVIDWLKKPEFFLQSIIHGKAWPGWVRDICRQHTGVGADGLLIIHGNVDAGVPEVLVYNADGSLGQICLNGLRCVAQYLVIRRGLPAKLTIKMGERNIACNVIKTDQGRAVHQITMTIEPAELQEQLPLVIDGESFEGHVVSIGNPHYINFRSIELPFLQKFGPLLESHSAFPLRTNVEFVWQDCHRDDLFHLLVYERGCGITNACSSGAAATLWLLYERGIVTAGAKIEIAMLGGFVTGWVQEGSLYLQASAVEVFSGSFAQDPQLY
jgi:diaminopimelate epimerase